MNEFFSYGVRLENHTKLSDHVLTEAYRPLQTLHCAAPAAYEPRPLCLDFFSRLYSSNDQQLSPRSHSTQPNSNLSSSVS